MTTERTPLQKLTAAQCNALSHAAYALMQARTHTEQLRELCERLSADAFIVGKELDAHTARFMVDRFRGSDAWSRSVVSHMASVLQQHGLDCGHSGEDAANLWRALNEQFYRADR